MALSFNLYYTGKNGAAMDFVREMEESGTADAIRKTPGNLRYSYFQSLDDPETVLLIDIWKDQAALDAHHGSEAMKTIARLRDQYDLHMKAERFETAPETGKDEAFIRR